MNISEFDRIISGATHHGETLEKFKDFLDAVEHVRDSGLFEKAEKIRAVLLLLFADVRLVRCAHGLYLPAAGDYLRGKPGADYHFREARVRRARLGAAARWLYQHQKKTFEQVVGLFMPFPVPPPMIELWWRKLLAAEMRCLRDARAHAG